MPTWTIWMLMPGGRGPDGWSRVAGGLTQAEAEWMVSKLFFKARVMQDQPDSNSER